MTFTVHLSIDTLQIMLYPCMFMAVLVGAVGWSETIFGGSESGRFTLAVATVLLSMSVVLSSMLMRCDGLVWIWLLLLTVMGLLGTALFGLLTPYT